MNGYSGTASTENVHRGHNTANSQIPLIPQNASNGNGKGTECSFQNMLPPITQIGDGSSTNCSITGSGNSGGTVTVNVNGNAVKVKINGEEVPYGLWERSSEFRQWFAKHLNEITAMPPKASTALTILVNSQRVLHSGDFLMKLFTGNHVQPHNVAIRSHLEFLFNMWKPSGTKKNKWKQFVKARTWLSSLPYPQMLQQFPEQFIVDIGST